MHGDEDLSPERLAQLEKESLGRIVHAFRQYQRYADLEIMRWQTNFLRLQPHHQALLPQIPAKCETAKRHVAANMSFITELLAAFDAQNAAGDEEADDDGGVPPHLAISRQAGDESAASQPECSPVDIDKVRYVLKNLVRDWSAEGAAERRQSYGRITDELRRLFPAEDRPPDKPPMVLVPGSGLARLVVEVAALGLEAQGNEFSYFMLLTASFMLNHIRTPRQFTIHPWLLGTCNHASDADQLRGVAVPDVHPADLVARPGLLSMCAGDFVECYATPAWAASFDCVVTCFFIDTAHNIIEYLEVISHVLKPGGYWLNLGPLLYHWADSGPREMSLEIPLDEVRRLAALFGLHIVRDEMVDASYIANERSMYRTVYSAAWWTAVKRPGGLLDALGAPPAPPPTTQHTHSASCASADASGRHAH